MEYTCPNGHDFPRAVAVPCEECGAGVACEPLAAGMRLHEEAEALGADLDRERAARRVVDEALRDAIRQRDEAVDALARER